MSSPSLSATLGELLILLDASPIHRLWHISDIFRLIVPPIELGQAVMLTDGERMVAFGSWALLTIEAEDGFRSGSRPIAADDWNAGDRLWVIDMIAPYGHARQLTAAMRDAHKSEAGRRRVFFRRNKGGVRRYSEVLA